MSSSPASSPRRLSTQLLATIVTYTDGQTDSTDRSISPPDDPTTLTLASGTATHSGVLSGSGTLIKAGAGSITLSGANTFIGPVQLNSGTLSIFHDSNLGAAGNAVTLAGGTLQTSSTYSSHPLAISSASTIDVARSISPLVTTLQNAALTGAATLTKTGAGTFFLAAGSGNTFSGDLTLAVNGGTFQIGSSVSSSPTGGSTLSSLTSANTITVNRSATFNIQDDGSIADRLGSAGNRPAVSMNGGTFKLSGANNPAVVTQTAGALILAAGASTINVTRANGTPELVFSSLTRNSGSFVNFTGINLGTAATNVPQILFNSPPALTGGGGAAGSTTVSILRGARSDNDLATYDTNGVRPLAAAEYNVVASNNINAAAVTENVKISDIATPAFAALSGPKTVNALVVTTAVNTTWAMGNTLTLTSGQFIDTTANLLNITSGVLTAGTGAAGTVDLDMSITTNGSVTLGANVNDNGVTSVALVKNGLTTLNLNPTSDSTYSGGTFINEGSMSTGSTANRRYLGTGAVVISNGSTLQLLARGATSFSGSTGSPTYTVKSFGEVQFFTDFASAATEFFRIESGAIITTRGPTSAGGLDLATNLNAAPGAVLAESVAGSNVAIKLGGVAIQTALTTPTYYFGLSASLISENITVGSGTPWLGISGSQSLYGGSATNNTVTANSDFTLQGKATGSNSVSALFLGFGASATNIVKIATPNGNVNAKIVGAASLNNDNSQYGSAGHTVTFQVTSGATLSAATATAQGVIGGAAISPATIVVQNGGILNASDPAAFNGNVAILPGGIFTQSQATLTGTGTFTHSNGSILNLTTSTAAVSGATQELGTVPGTIVRLGVNGLLPGTSTAGMTQLDSRLDDAAIYELAATVTMGAASAATDSLFTLSASGGLGGVLTNGVAFSLGANTGLIAIGAGGGTFAATTGTTFTVSEDFSLGANTLTMGSAQSYDGNPKLGTVSLNAAANSSTGSAGSVVSVFSGATLRLAASDQIPDAATLSVNSGGTADLQTFTDTVGGVILTGGTISSTTGVLTSATAFELRGGTVSASLGGTVGMNKTTAGVVTLSGTNSYTGTTTVSGGELRVTGSIATSVLTLVNGGTLSGTGIVGALTLQSGVLAPGTGAGTLNSGNLLLSGGIFAVEIASAVSADQLNVTGTAGLGANTELSLTLLGGFDPQINASWVLVNNDVSDAFTTGTFRFTSGGNPIEDNTPFTVGGETYVLQYNGGTGNDVVLTTTVPEPGTAAFLLAGLPLIALRRRRRVEP